MPNSALNTIADTEEVTDVSRAHRRLGMVWPIPKRPPTRLEEVTEPKRGLLSTLLNIFRLPTDRSSLVTSPSRSKQLLFSTCHAGEAERNFIKEVEEFGANSTLSYEEKEAYGNSILQLPSLAHTASRSADTRSHLAPAGKGRESQVAFVRSSKDTCGPQTAVGHDDAISALHAKVLAEVLIHPAERKIASDVDSLLSDRQGPGHRRSGSVRFLQTDSAELQVTKWRAFAMFALNKSEERCPEGCLYACRADGCGSVRPTFRSLVYHLHLHNVNSGIKRAGFIREYCDACDTTFETHRDLIVHRCLSITDTLEEHVSEKTIHVTGKDRYNRLSQLAKRLSPMTPRSNSA